MNYAARSQMLDIEAERWWWEDEFLLLFMFIWGTHVPFLGYISKGQKTMTQKNACKFEATLLDALDVERAGSTKKSMFFKKSLDSMSHFCCKHGMELSPGLQTSV